MDEPSGLIAEELLDCHGRTTFRLVLDVDGTVLVTVASSGVTVRVEPSTRTLVTPGAVLPDEVLGAAAALGVH